MPCPSTNRVFPLSRAISSREFCTYVTLFSLSAGCCALAHSPGAAGHRTFPQLNLHRARVRRNHGRLPSNGFIERAQSSVLVRSSSAKRASDKALAFKRRTSEEDVAHHDVFDVVLHGSFRTAWDCWRRLLPVGYSGDTWTGEVVSTSDTTREITLSYTNGKKSEIFTGVLKDNFQVKMKDGSMKELNPSGIPKGARITVFYQAKTKKVDGNKVKVSRNISAQYCKVNRRGCLLRECLAEKG